jgi:hypothetical protein
VCPKPVGIIPSVIAPAATPDGTFERRFLLETPYRPAGFSAAAISIRPTHGPLPHRGETDSEPDNLLRDYANRNELRLQQQNMAVLP